MKFMFVNSCMVSRRGHCRVSRAPPEPCLRVTERHRQTAVWHGQARALSAQLLRGTGERTGRVQADRRQECRLKLLFQKCRGMRELVSSRMCLALERVDALEVEIAALGEV